MWGSSLSGGALTVSRPARPRIHSRTHTGTTIIAISLLFLVIAVVLFALGVPLIVCLMFSIWSAAGIGQGVVVWRNQQATGKSNRWKW